MYRLLLFIALLTPAIGISQFSFQTAYSNNPWVPQGLLEAVAWTNTHMVHLENQQGSCIGYPKAYGIMGLHDNGLNYFIENGEIVANLSGISISAQKSSAQNQINAYAVAFNQLMNMNGASTSIDPALIRTTLHQLSEIPDSGAVNILARDMQVYSIMEFMCSQEKAQQYGFQAHHFNLAQLFGNENYAVLSGKRVIISPSGIENENGTQFSNSQNMTLEYGPALWDPAASCNYSSRNGVAISAITIHTVQGTYAGCISWFQNCSASVSAHYVIRSLDGQVTQMVLEADKAWHVGTENPYTIGFEHEGWVNDPSWYTEEMYNSSADLSRDIVNSGYGIPPLRTFYGDATVGTNTIGGCTKIKGHQHYPNQTHTDPGINWDWEKYYQLINNNPGITTVTNPTGAFYDSGGSAAEYTDDERELWLFQPPNVASVTLDFTSFNLELNYDYLFIYDGDSIGAPLIGKYTGTNSPGLVTSSGGSLLVEFRSDCSTTAPGWEVNYSSVPLDINPPTTSIIPDPNWKTADFVVYFNDQDAESGIAERYYNVSEKLQGVVDPSANGIFGFVRETFEDNASNWTSTTAGHSIIAGEYVFSDTNQQNSNSYIWVEQVSPGTYLYEWDQIIYNTASNQRAGMHFMCDDPTLPNRGNSYFVYLRASDQVQIYSVDNDVFNLELDTNYTINTNQVYNVKVSYSTISGLIKVYIDNALVATWADTTPHFSGNSISLRTGGCEAGFDNINVYRSRVHYASISVGATSEMSLESENAVHTGFLQSVVLDGMENWSTVIEDSFLIDYSVPDIVFLNDGAGADIDTFTTSVLQANYQATDIHSAIQEYEIAVGTLPNLDDIYPWTSNGILETFSTILANPIYNEVYHISVRARNGAGLNELYISNGQRYIDDLGVLEEQMESMEIYPNPATDKISFINGPNSLDLYIYDETGKLCSSVSKLNSEIVDISNLAAGKYNVVVKSGDIMIVKQLIIH